ncbi:unnamed protein product [Nippostrongylus brasiliensis]|uniref:ML domain-containing protein n=1 Tax=Nippostrongylus brasiliensis TaxID=27835 RepID=A0A0N4YGU2_NIPBR|nr:hypothetical protein Q1695_014291 [Nippostrongylus brasiliensis]VDL79639.1 unnamed protein product [Nippostrongylus brasiliensis]
MKTTLLVLLSIIGTVHCSQCSTWPNGTDKAFHWWQCNDGPISFLDAKIYDKTGKQVEYPIQLSEQLVFRCEIANPTRVYGSPNLRLNIRIWSWGTPRGACEWSPVPTLGLLSNLDACKNGVKCPVAVGRQKMDVVVDFTRFKAIIALLKDDTPYQLQYELHDRFTGDNACFMGQARARTK